MLLVSAFMIGKKLQPHVNMNLKILKVELLVLTLAVYTIGCAYAWLETPPWYNELFGDGDFYEKASHVTEKHLSRQKQKHILIWN